MSTAITKAIDPQLVHAAKLMLRPEPEEGDDLAMLFESEDDSGDGYDFVPVRAKIPSGGGKNFEIDDEALKEMKAVIVLSQKARALFLGDGQDSPPLCSSADAQTGIFNADLGEQFELAARMPIRMQHPGVESGSGAYDCLSCPLNQWGSDPKGGKGKACKELRRLVLIVEGINGEIFLTLPPTSTKTFDAYASGRRRQKSAYWGQWTMISLEQVSNAAGIKYSKVTFSPDEKLDISTVKAVKVLRDAFSEYVKEVGIVADDYDMTNGNGSTDTADVEF